MQNVDFATYELLDAAKRILIEHGWTAKEQNDPERAIVGFVLCDPKIQEMQWLRWMPFGRELEPKIVTYDSGPEFIALLRSLVIQPGSGSLFEPCHDMGNDMCGFAWYSQYKAGIAEVYRINMNTLISNDEVIHDLRSILMQVQLLAKSEKTKWQA
jgi:hypothetical protein